MKKKFLFLCSGSPRDPGFEDVKIDGLLVREYLGKKDVTVIDKLVMSCDGCHDLMSYYAGQAQSYADAGNRVVCVAQGGLRFGLPGIFATQVTFPVISIPTDFVAYTGIMVPPGPAAVMGVGVERKGEYYQRARALKLAERILNLENPKIGVIEDRSEGFKLTKELEKYGLDTTGISGWGGLKLAYNERPGIPNADCHPLLNDILLRADSDSDVSDWNYLKRAEERHHQTRPDVVMAQVHRLDNLALVALRVMSLQKPELMDKIKKVAKDKRDSYEERNLCIEITQMFEVDPTKK